MFDVMFALYCQTDIVIYFKINETLQSVLFGKSWNQSLSVLSQTAQKIACHVHVKNSVGAIGQDINVRLSHWRSCLVDGRDKPGHDAEFA
jgi:hypothetical protein